MKTDFKRFDGLNLRRADKNKSDLPDAF